MFGDRIIEALQNAKAHWLRVVLTSAGILWGMTLFIVDGVGLVDRRVLPRRWRDRQEGDHALRIDSQARLGTACEPRPRSRMMIRGCRGRR
jgi:hypothetical protein